MRLPSQEMHANVRCHIESVILSILSKTKATRYHTAQIIIKRKTPPLPSLGALNAKSPNTSPILTVTLGKRTRYRSSYLYCFRDRCDGSSSPKRRGVWPAMPLSLVQLPGHTADRQPRANAQDRQIIAGGGRVTHCYVQGMNHNASLGGHRNTREWSLIKVSEFSIFSLLGNVSLGNLLTSTANHRSTIPTQLDSTHVPGNTRWGRGY